MKTNRLERIFLIILLFLATAELHARSPGITLKKVGTLDISLEETK